MRKFLISLLLLTTMTSSILFSQSEIEEWDWQWGNDPKIYNAFRTLGITTDFSNNSYIYYRYFDSISIGDTSFIHPPITPGRKNYNVAVIKQNSRGEQVKVLDIYTQQDESIDMFEMEIDQESNLFITGTFRDTLFISNNLVTTTAPGINIFLIKLTSDFQFLWGKTISGYGQNNCACLTISNDYSIYLSVKHHGIGYDSTICMINYLGQDSALVGNGLNSLLKINSDGSLIWRKEIRDVQLGTSYIYNTFNGNDDNIYLIGRSTYCISIEGDTLNHPDFPYFSDDEVQYIACFNNLGECLNSFFINIDNFGIYEWDIEVDKNSNYYISGSLWRSTIWGSDTIVIPENKHGEIIAKMDSSFQPLWNYHLINSDQIIPWFYINLIDDRLAFSTSGKGDFTFGDVNFSIEPYFQVILGLFDTAGQLVSYQITETTEGANVFKTEIDNCGNFLITGYFEGDAYFGNDTITADLPYERYIAKNYRGNPLPLNMPNDTSGCSELKLIAPEGYLHYKWNNVLLEQNWILIKDSEKVTLAVANDDGCWSECEINVTIFPKIVFSLGQDTTILLTDSLEINIDDFYASYHWSTGDTFPTINISANKLELGHNQIWLEVNNGPCSASDTINVFVIDNSGIIEINDYSIYLYPNPAKERLNIINRSNIIIDNVNIYTLNGLKLISTKPINKTIDIAELLPGIYIIELVTNHLRIRKKLVIK